MNATTSATAAELLGSARRSRTAIPPLTSTFPDFTVDEAYGAQLVNVRERLESGARIVGHKVGLTSVAMQEMLGVSEPDYGHLLDDMAVTGSVEAGRFLQPRVEIEIAFVLGEPLKGPGVTEADVLAATRFVAPAIEIIDSRIADWQIKLADTVADNGSAGGFVVGDVHTPPSEVDLPAVSATLSLNGQEVATGTGAAVLGDPATAVCWLANKLAAFGASLDAGHIVLPGSCTRAFDVRAGDQVEARFEGLGSATVVFE
ncbi:MAG TPA: 2-keto-4-pentenoate hydratase [Acidimicrobiales bacterium]|nr:2-keto-4-pentenoate hydratase [Acidimicrobiales bacterium]